MGVPAFFRWLSRKYPSVIVNCVEVTPKDANGKLEPVDASQPNPNGIEFDNLYLDMNGIIHPCTHPEDKPAPKDEDEMMIAIFEAIDRLLNIVRPRKLLYMAIDGVAPRAKMNQQRSRRFRASKEAYEKKLEVAKIRAKLESEGAILPPPKDSSDHFDSNCITPGTPFMTRLSKCLHYYAHKILNNNPAWKDLKVILSDANVPGEGEHKIMDFIRKQRAQPNHDPNTKHCLCGADADLMMLGLATHEPHFYIIREEFKPNMDRPCDVCGLIGHTMEDCQGLEKNQEVLPAFSSEVQFIFVRLFVLREYLKRELEMPGLPFPYDFERAVDDWVFMCFFVGNDFLPHLPSLEIREGAIDRLVNLYKKAVYKTGGYLTDDGTVALHRIQVIMTELGIVEDEIFKKRQQTEEMFRARDKAKRKRLRMANNRDRPTHVLSGQYAPTSVGRNVAAVVNPRQEVYQQRVQSMHTDAQSNKPEEARNLKRKAETPIDSDDEPEVHDEVRLWEAGFKERYYESKFDVTSDNPNFHRKVALEYVKGLCWVLKYYYQGCPSWEWYFPYHYAPFASDFVQIASEPVVFPKNTKPFKPLEQLMSVFPAASKQHIPEAWAKLMTDPFSPIIDFYPEDFKIDLNGKKFAWQGVALLPFVDEERLHKALKPLYEELTEAELQRNCLGDERLFVSDSGSSYTFLIGLYENDKNFEMEVSLLTDGILGRVLLADDNVNRGGSLPSPVRGLEVIRNNIVACVRYRDVKFGEDHIYSTQRLVGAEDPPPILKPQNLTGELHNNWKPQIGMVPSTQVATLGIAGHRMLGHYTHADRGKPPGPYSAVAPPTYRGASNNYYDRNRTSQPNRNQDRYSNDRRPYSLFAQQRNDQRGYSGNRQDYRNNSRNDSATTTNSGHGYAASYTANANRFTQEHSRPAYQNMNKNQSYGYQTYQSHSQMGGPRPSGHNRGGRPYDAKFNRGPYRQQ